MPKSPPEPEVEAKPETDWLRIIATLDGLIGTGAAVVTALWFIGTFPLNGTSVFLAFALLAFANLHYQILQEEHFLAEVHGTKYERYCRRTPRYFALRRAPRRRVVL